jgi:CBS domain containing-hemolysin-like protein
MTLLIFYVLLALGVSFVCSIMEAVLLSVTPSHVALLDTHPTPVSKALSRLKSDVDRPLVAILTLNTIAHTVGAAGAGAQANAVFGTQTLCDTSTSVCDFPVVGLFTALLTVLILVVSEIIPKTLGAVYWRSLIPVVVRSLQCTIAVLTPVVWALQAITNLLNKDKKQSTISREEMGALAELGVQQGTIDKEESKILSNLLRFNSLCARDVMTPRTVIFGLTMNATVSDVMSADAPLRFSRIPLFEQGIDDVKGYILKDRLLLEAAQGRGQTSLPEFMRPLHVVPESSPLPKIFEQMLNKRESVALVVDEYGGTEGILTMEDIVETLLGYEIVDEMDSVEDMQAYARRAWATRARSRGIDIGVLGLDDESLSETENTNNKDKDS